MPVCSGPSITYEAVVVATSMARSRTSMRPTHLTLLIPTQPGTMARAGPP